MNTISGQTGQGFYNPISPKTKSSSSSIEEVKALHNPRHYYPAHLKGQFGRMGASGWCQWHGLCPFHADTKAGSVSINLHTGAYKCFACGASAGDVLAFHGKLYNLSFKETLQALGGCHE
jgi:putative DNA primase/helicase